jgi:hypothetical protein
VLRRRPCACPSPWPRLAEGNKTKITKQNYKTNNKKNLRQHIPTYVVSVNARELAVEKPWWPNTHDHKTMGVGL